MLARSPHLASSLMRRSIWIISSQSLFPQLFAITCTILPCMFSCLQPRFCVYSHLTVVHSHHQSRVAAKSKADIRHKSAESSPEKDTKHEMEHWSNIQQAYEQSCPTALIHFRYVHVLSDISTSIFWDVSGWDSSSVSDLNTLQAAVLDMGSAGVNKRILMAPEVWLRVLGWANYIQWYP